MRVIIRETKEDGSKWTADYIVDRINKFSPTEEKPFVLGVSCGSSPLLIYKHLVEYYKKGLVSFANVVTFNTDELVGIPADHPHSYHSYMFHNLFKHVNINPKNVNMLDGNAENLEVECDRYEEKIKSVGGIELFVAGVGEDGHVAMNEPGSSLESTSSVKLLSRQTILLKAAAFGGADKVPNTGLSMGWGTIMAAREMLIIAWGQNKAAALAKCIERSVSHMYTMSALQKHSRACVVCDQDATAELRVRTVKYFQGLEQVTRMLEQNPNRAVPPAAKL
mmetsp:Transcript_49574/g.97205  ORF Transcript_49574/g.97205 Transcript_49574/m.97205 type:complete len:279 (+) Transcript_49574:170-1006(+)|eukprot:CAMPEP_0175145564 /NCGR_PEP_ID=MMETSP0087-20121206/14849_1 /TAXON_ID=136419 /ORGANISM="Unknown Unknown, Strain D1" /LENGTH=278 /DNA_ID=CAMNT_0016430341 /DNA_START=1058 /DNA_END=1894 /DNA_ORIENTATION=+